MSPPAPPSVLIAASLLIASPGCASRACPNAEAPAAGAEPTDDRGGAESADAAAQTIAPASTPAASGLGFPALMSFEPDESTPAEVREQFGQLVGAWSCRGESIQADGSLKETPGQARWTFFYILDGQAIGDIFEQGGAVPAVGMNLRIYDPASGQWTLAWTTSRTPRFDHFEARQEGETLVMLGDVAARGAFPDHRARITFSELRATSFEWVRDAAQAGTDGPWQTVAKLHCEALAERPGRAG